MWGSFCLSLLSAGVTGRSYDTHLSWIKEQTTKQPLASCGKSTEYRRQCCTVEHTYSRLAWDCLCLSHRTSAAPRLFLPDVARVGQGTTSAEMKPCSVPKASGWLHSKPSGLCPPASLGSQPAALPLAPGLWQASQEAFFLLASCGRTMAPPSLPTGMTPAVAGPTVLFRTLTFRVALLGSESISHF